MKFNTEEKTQSETKNHTNNKELIAQIEKQLSIAVWIKFIGSIMEAIYAFKILKLNEEEESDSNERLVVQGIWIQTIGQLFESVGITRQALTRDEVYKFEGAEISNVGDWIQVVGGLIESYAGRQIILEERTEPDENENLYVP